MLTIPTWYVPSFYGDLKLTATSETSCDLISTQVTKQERDALLKLEKHAQKEEWIAAEQMIAPEGTTKLRAPIEAAAKLLAKLLKPGRTQISAVRFKDGTMEEIRSTQAEPTGSVAVADTTSGSPQPQKNPAVATTVAAPTRGCPPPDFCQAEIRAQRVLAAFLTTDQLEDFRRHQKFISVGQTTGNRYMITSRHARDQLAQYTRTLYDLDRKTPICTHDWDVPAAEEMLALHVLIQLPGWETYLNELVEDNVDDVTGNAIRTAGGYMIRNARTGQDVI